MKREEGLNSLNVDLKSMALLIKTQFTSWPLNSEKIDNRTILQEKFAMSEKKFTSNNIFEKIRQTIKVIENHLKNQVEVDKIYIPVIIENLRSKNRNQKIRTSDGTKFGTV